jgi:tetratricopeptide (TPR) repeat protein
MGRKRGSVRAGSIAVIACATFSLALAGSLCAAEAPQAAATGTATPPVATAPAVVNHDTGASAVESARRRVASGDLAGAVAELAAYVGSHPHEPDPARYLGDLYYRSSNLSAAESTYRTILAFAPLDRETHDRLGGVYSAEDRSSEAIEQFQLSLPYGSAYGHLVELHRHLGDLDDFVEGFKSAVSTSPFDGGALYALGAIYRAMHRTSDAIGMLERALVQDPLSCPVLSELGSAYLDSHDNQQAIQSLHRCLSLEPKNFAALVNLGSAYIEDGRDADALPYLQRANDLRPDQPDALIDFGDIEDDNGRWQNALTDFLKAASLDPLDRDAYVNLGFDYSSHRLFALAEAALLKGISISPSDGRLHYLLAKTYVDQGKRDLARAEFKRAAASDQPDVVSAAQRDLAAL